MENKFKVGDCVRIRVWDDMEKEFGINGYNSINCQAGFTEKMRYLCGKTAYIKNIKPNGYVFLELDNPKDSYKWRYTTDMIELIEDKEIVITFDGSTTKAQLVYNNIITKESYAKCSSSDRYDAFIGAQLALERLIKNELSVGDIVTVTDLRGCYPRYADWILKYAPEYAVFFKFDTPLLTEPDELPYTIRVMSPHIKDTDTQLCLIQRNELIPEKGPCYIVAAKALKKVSD